MIIGIVFLVLVGLFIVGLFPALVDIWVETFGHGARYSRAVRDHELMNGRDIGSLSDKEGRQA